MLHDLQMNILCEFQVSGNIATVKLMLNGLGNRDAAKLGG